MAKLVVVCWVFYRRQTYLEGCELMKVGGKECRAANLGHEVL